MNIIEKLLDLHKQATTERSHYYVASTDTDRKLLTEYLGECWQEDMIVTEWISYPDINGPECYTTVDPKDGTVGKKRLVRLSQQNRTFTTPDDFFALKDKLVEKGEWNEFRNLMYARWVREGWNEFSDWIINPTRFPELVAEWLTSRRTSG